MSKDLLVFAAKAVGYTYQYVNDLVEGEYLVIKELGTARWNPLENNADAFKRRVDLRSVVTNPPGNMKKYVRASGAIG